MAMDNEFNMVLGFHTTCELDFHNFYDRTGAS